MSGNTAFISYVLLPSGISDGSYSQAIHCNYIKKIDLGTTDPYIQEISLNFPRINMGYFKFLTSGVTVGYSMNRVRALVQIVPNTLFNSYNEVKPDSTKWKQFDITSQVTGFSTNADWLLTPANITSVVFKIPFLNYDNTSIFLPYNLAYLNYPGTTEADHLVFGDATYFFGNVTATIKAEVYTTDISIILPQPEFNWTTNPTFNTDLDTTVYISEIGIYDSNKNLVAIGKLNDPVAKNPSIGRTIVFALDF